MSKQRLLASEYFVIGDWVKVTYCPPGGTFGGIVGEWGMVVGFKSIGAGTVLEVDPDWTVGKGIHPAFVQICRPNGVVIRALKHKKQNIEDWG